MVLKFEQQEITRNIVITMEAIKIDAEIYLKILVDASSVCRSFHKIYI